MDLEYCVYASSPAATDEAGRMMELLGDEFRRCSTPGRSQRQGGVVCDWLK